MTQPHIVRPTAIQMPFGPGVEAYLFGRDTGNWSLKTNLDWASRSIADFAAGKEVRIVLAPRLDFSANSVSGEELHGGIITVPKPGGDVRILRGKEDAGADVVEVPRGEGVFMNSGDCPLILMQDNKNHRLCCAHAGLNCLFDRGKMNGRPARNHESVIETCLTILNSSLAHIERGKHLRVWVMCGIAGEHFTHPQDDPKWGPENMLMIDLISRKFGPRCFVGERFSQGALSLKSVIRSQLGVISCSTDHIDTYGDTNDGAGPVWWSNRRGDIKERNGIMVIHR